MQEEHSTVVGLYGDFIPDFQEKLDEIVESPVEGLYGDFKPALQKKLDETVKQVSDDHQLGDGYRQQDFSIKLFYINAAGETIVLEKTDQIPKDTTLNYMVSNNNPQV